MRPWRPRFTIRSVMALVVIAGLLIGTFAHIYRLLNPPPPVPDFQMATLYLHEAKLRLSAAERAKDPERTQRLLVGAEYDLLLSQIHAVKAELSQGNLPNAPPSRKR